MHPCKQAVYILRYNSLTLMETADFLSSSLKTRLDADRRGMHHTLHCASTGGLNVIGNPTYRENMGLITINVEGLLTSSSSGVGLSHSPGLP